MKKKEALESIDRLLIRYSALLAILAILTIVAFNFVPTIKLRIAPQQLIGLAYGEGCRTAADYNKVSQEYLQKYSDTKKEIYYSYYLSFLQRALETECEVQP